MIFFVSVQKYIWLRSNLTKLIDFIFNKILFFRINSKWPATPRASCLNHNDLTIITRLRYKQLTQIVDGIQT